MGTPQGPASAVEYLRARVEQVLVRQSRKRPRWTEQDADAVAHVLDRYQGDPGPAPRLAPIAARRWTSA